METVSTVELFEPGNLSDKMMQTLPSAHIAHIDTKFSFHNGETSYVGLPGSEAEV